MLVIGLLAVNQSISSVRFYVVGRAFALPAALSRAHRVNLNSIAGSMLVFNFLGQGLTRAVLFREYCVSRSVMFLITALERALSFAMLIGVGVIVLLNAYGVSAIQWSDLIGLAVVATTVLLGLAAAFFGGLRRRARREAVLALRGPLFGRLVVAAALTLTMHAAMLSAYALLAAKTLDAPIDSALLIAAVVTMLGAAFPAAPGGWGAREATSVYAFSQLGASAAEGVQIGVAIGLLSLGALAINLGLVYASRLGRRAARGRLQVEEIAEGALTLRRLRALCWIGPMLVALLAAFQAPVPMGKSFVTINAADPAAIVVALSAVSVLLLGLARGRAWAPQGFALGLVALSVSIAAAFVIGFVRYGLIEWALVNRLIGAGVVLSFLVSGAFLAVVSGAVATRRLARSLAMLCASIIVIEFAARLVGLSEYFEALHWDRPTYVGLLENRNAWSIFLCATLALHLALARPAGARRTPWLAAVLVFGALLTGSRSGFVALGLLLPAMALIGRVHAVRLGLAVAALFAGAAAAELLLSAACAALAISSGSFGGALAAFGHVQPLDHVQPDRWTSVLGGVRLFLEHPLFGAGLGAFMNEQLEQTGQPLVIHSTFLWLLAEFGLVGALLFLSPALLALRQVAVDPVWRRSDQATALLGVLLVAGVFGLVHDMAYQRLIWFLIGLLAARPASLRGALRAPAADEFLERPRQPVAETAGASATAHDGLSELRVR